MQYKFFECINYGKVFWNNDTENKPDRLYLNSLEFKEISTAFNYINQYIASINYPTDYYLSNKPNYFKVTDDTSNFVRFYFLKDISKENNETTTLTLELDIWSTYLLPSLVKNEDKPIELVRSHLLNDSNYQITDQLLDSIPITYDQIYVNKLYYEYNKIDDKFVYTLEPKNQYTDRLLEINENDIVNANIYYGFKGLNLSGETNDTYYFIPILTDSGSSKIKDGKPSSESVITTITINKQADINGAQALYEATKAQYPKANWRWVNAPNIPNYIEPLQLIIRETVDKTCQHYGGATGTATSITTTTSTTYLNDVAVYSKSASNRSTATGVGWCITWPAEPNVNAGLILQASNADGEVVYETTEIFNNEKYVKSLVSNTEFANLFLGKFIMPNIMSFYNKIEVKSSDKLSAIAVVAVNPDGVEMSNLKVVDLELDYNDFETYNSTIIKNKIIFRYFQIKYLNAELNSRLYYMDNVGEINIGGLFMFSGSPAIVSRNKYLSSTENIINLPYQLPSVSDEYINYYSQTMSQVNTGLKHAEINAAMGLSQGVFNTVMGGANGFLSASAAKKEGNSPIGGIMSGVSSIINGGFGLANTALGLTQYKENNTAKWADVARISGASFAASNIQDAAVLTNYVVKDNFCEICEIRKPNENTIKLLNNILFLYGNMTPMSIPIADITPRQKFNFIQVNQSWAATNLPTFLANENIDVINRCVAMLANGVRLWRIFPNYDVEN